jgi:hydroxypyruvate isomerase
MKFGLCLEMVFGNDPMETRLKKAAQIGFENVEMWFVDGTYKGEPEALGCLASENGVIITNTVIGSPDGSIGGGLTDPRRRYEWLERTRMTLEFNQRAGIPATIVCTGNTVPGRSEKELRQSVVDGLLPTVELAEKAGVTLLLEVLNDRHDHPGYWLTSSDLGAEICRQIGSEKLRLLFDCYHMQVMEGDLCDHISRNIDVIGHFHSAGVPGRHEIFRGEVDYAFLLRHIQLAGYQKIFAFEYLPSEDDVRSISMTLEHVKKALQTEAMPIMER